MKNKLHLFIYVILLSQATICFAQKLTPQSEMKLSLSAGDGTLDLSELVLEQDVLPHIRGNVTNNTKRDLNYATIKILTYDKNGEAIRDSITSEISFTVRGLKRGETKMIGLTRRGEMLSIYSRTKVAQYELHLKSATFSISYDVLLVKPSQSKELNFEDNFISIQWLFDKKALGFVLRNKTDNPIKIDS